MASHPPPIREVEKAHKPSEVMQRFRFNTRSRKNGESIAPYFAELRKLAGRSLGDMIRDRLVCGINDETIKRKLLTEPDLTYTKSLSTAKGPEAAA